MEDLDRLLGGLSLGGKAKKAASGEKKRKTYILVDASGKEKGSHHFKGSRPGNAAKKAGRAVLGRKEGKVKVHIKCISPGRTYGKIYGKEIEYKFQKPNSFRKQFAPDGKVLVAVSVKALKK